MSNSRRFFRYDVKIPCYIEPILGEVEAFVPVSVQRLVASPMYKEFQNERVKLYDLLKQASKENMPGLVIVDVLLKRLEFTQWMIDALVEGKSPKSFDDFSYRRKHYVSFKKPELGSGNKIRSLIDSQYDQVKVIADELLETVDTAPGDKMFFYPNPQMAPYEHLTYVTNLVELAKKGVLLAQILNGFSEWLNWMISIHNELKKSQEGTASPDNWPLKDINLSQGGIAFRSDKEFPKFTNFSVVMKLDNSLIYFAAKLVSCRKPKDLDSFIVALEFDMPEAQKQQQILNFIQRDEVRMAMKVAMGT